MNIKAALKQRKNKNNVKICMSKVHKMAQQRKDGNPLLTRKNPLLTHDFI